MAWKDYFNKAFDYLENVKKYGEKRDHKAALSVGFSSIELLIKGFMLKEIGRPPMHLSQVLKEKKMLEELRKNLSEEDIKNIKDIDEKMNALYLKKYSPNREDTEKLLEVIEKSFQKLNPLQNS